ncbi:uncharacterized protein LOC127290597 [Leptopilina boulardi]|uniref:uncharacterized protein LOC127290597 n=1 Tax=Leptopilina boulardi TaxID=63433 RepID=UPI0021F6134E|nr:uncharacterized protein LOC127290597 [Leptopilina boulardi]
MTMQRRLLLSSKKREEVQFRKSVTECYCNRQTRKMQLRSNRTKIKPTTCKHCKSLIDLRPMAWVESNDIQPTELSTPISCETVRRVSKINYSPQSEFLQKKISSTQNFFDKKLQPSSKYDSHLLSAAGDTAQNCPKTIHSICRNIQPEIINEINNESNFHDSIEICKKSTCPKQSCSYTSKEFQINSKKPLREKLAKRTISSKKTLSTSESVQSQKTKNSNITSKGRARSSQSSNKSQYHEKCYNDANFRECNVIPKYSKHTKDFLGKTNQDKIIDDPMENPLTNLYKFREQNYFDTHGSTHTLLSSGSSGSLEKYILNERLFPQPVGKVHRGDLVVTMPSCITNENKMIHYFPRYIVRQEKNQATKTKKKHTCPLTGHLIDVKNLKVQNPSNSLALRFQKGVS